MPWVRSPGLRVVGSREPGAGGRCPLHDRDRGCDHDRLSSFLPPLLTISMAGASLCSRLEVPGVARGPGVGVPETTGQVAQRLAPLCSRRHRIFSLRGPAGPWDSLPPSPAPRFIVTRSCLDSVPAFPNCTKNCSPTFAPLPRRKKSLWVMV